MLSPTLSRVESVTAPPSHESLAAAQNSDDELRTLLAANNVLRLEKQPIPGTTVSIYSDTCAGKSRPYIPAPIMTTSVPVHPRPVGHQSNSETGHIAFRVARHTEGLSHLGTGLPSLSTLQSLLPHCYSTERFHSTTSPFSSCSHRPHWTSSNASRLHILPDCS
jgi:hypothetical protein